MSLDPPFRLTRLPPGDRLRLVCAALVEPEEAVVSMQERKPCTSKADKLLAALTAVPRLRRERID